MIKILRTLGSETYGRLFTVTARVKTGESQIR